MRDHCRHHRKQTPLPGWVSSLNHLRIGPAEPPPLAAQAYLMAATHSSRSSAPSDPTSEGRQAEGRAERTGIRPGMPHHARLRAWYLRLLLLSLPLLLHLPARARADTAAMSPTGPVQLDRQGRRYYLAVGAVFRDEAPPSPPNVPPWRQPRGETIVSLVNSHTNATSRR